jgi:putative flippase GtrA
MSKWRDERRVVTRYIAAGLLNAVVSLSTIYGCLAAGLSPLVANVAGYAVGILISFSLSKMFVFESRRRTGPEFRRYVVAFAFSFMVNLAVLEVLTRSPRIAPFVAQLIAISTYVLLMFAFSRWVIFKGGLEERLAQRSRKAL